jgi:hypothetical protein
VAIWLIFRVAHFSRTDSDMFVVRALKISQMTDGVCLLFMTRCTFQEQVVELLSGNELKIERFGFFS